MHNVHAYIRAYTHRLSAKREMVMCVCCREKTSSLSSRLAELRRRNKCFCISERYEKEAKKYRSQSEYRTKEKKREEKKTRKIENDNGNHTNRLFRGILRAPLELCVCVCVCVYTCDGAHHMS